MIKKIKNRTETYQITKNFFVDVQYENDIAEFYLYHMDFGIKKLMFAIKVERDIDIIKIIEDHVELSIFDYKIDVMDKNPAIMGLLEEQRIL